LLDDDFFDAGFDVADVSHDGLLPRCLFVSIRTHRKWRVKSGTTVSQLARISENIR
jgi:hypothetical protein